MKGRRTPVAEFMLDPRKTIRELGAHREPLVLTEDGKARAVLQDPDAYKKQQEAMALLVMLQRTDMRVRAGKHADLDAAFDEVIASIPT